ncbi:uncharacterized protein Bfra_001451 [Botrytis fragariae]|uniref:Uncharacterized protein n=1 Tax=Botrytis fragariae TaxID=1964551 RepID=A0A8H6B0W2_9HELO|nr:uncharacterized protein Bfra_001451 [Botrytis fragariae]KAF5877090.1 hypothetical protein Bfra_001451 [Botrytis fragariae]
MKNNNTDGKGRARPRISASASDQSHLQAFVELPVFCLHCSTIIEAMVEINDLGSDWDLQVGSADLWHHTISLGGSYAFRP